MTKMKSKKMSKSTFAVIIMAIVMVAMLAFGGTYAYFTATTYKKQADMKMGTVSLKSSGSFATISTKVAPTQTILNGKIQYTNESTVDSYVAVRFNALYTGYLLHDAETTTENVDAYHEYVTEDKDAIAIMSFNAKGEKLDDEGNVEGSVDYDGTQATLGYLIHVTNYPMTASQINSAFKAVVDGTETGLAELIDDEKWVVGTGEYANIYMMKGASNLVVPARTFAQDENYQPAVFIDAETNAVKFDVDRHFVEGKWDISEASKGDLQWEDADVTISVEAYSIQTLGITYDANGAEAGGETTLTTENATANATGVENVWKAMKVLLEIA